jgi:uncharacterized membrane protein YdbT with pleckstrin-like domain
MSIVWTDKKRWTFFGLPFTFTRYSLTEDKILVDTGLFTSRQEEIRLYRVLDLSLTRTLWQKMFKLGTITLKTADKTLPTLIMKNVKDSLNVKEKISNMVEEERTKKRVSTREFMNDVDDDGNFDDDID